MDVSNYEKIKADSEVYFSNLRPQFCHALNETVNFTAEGFNHIIYKKGRTEREKSSQIMRLKLLTKAVKLIEITTTIQEFEETLKTFEIKRYKKKVTVPKSVKYWGLIAIIDSYKIKVIIRKIGNGNAHFWSVIPSWITNKTRDYKFVYTMSGKPEED